MSEQPTPETDAAVLASEGQWSFVLKETCQKFERERDEAREALKHIDEYGTEEINAAVELRQKLAQALVERDEAREALDEEMKFHHRTHAELVQTQCQMQDVIREREASLEAAK